MQLRSKITVARNIIIHHHSLLKAKRKTQLFSVKKLWTDSGKNTTQTNEKSDLTPFTYSYCKGQIPRYVRRTRPKFTLVY